MSEVKERKPVLKIEEGTSVDFELMFDELKTFQGKKWKSEELETKYVTVIRLVNDYGVYKAGQELSFFPTRLTAQQMNQYEKGSKLRITRTLVGEGDYKRTRYDVSVIEGKMKDFKPPSKVAESVKEEDVTAPNSTDVIKKGTTHTDLTEEESESMTKIIKWTMDRGTIINIFDFKNKWLQKFPGTDDIKLQKLYGVYEFTFKFAKVKY